MAQVQTEMQPYRRFSLAERDRRWKAIRELMASDHLDALVAPPNLGNSTDWQADARYISHCGGGLDASIGVSGLGFGTRTPEGTIFHGTYMALREALPDAEFIPASDLL